MKPSSSSATRGRRPSRTPIAALDQLAGARLVPAGEVALRDVYLDTPARALSGAG